MAVNPYDEANIKTDDIVIRRINPVEHVVWDDNRNCHRVSTKAFQKSSGENAGMSVDIEALIVAAGMEPKRFVTTPVFTASVSFPAGRIRRLDLMVGYDPVKNSSSAPDNPYHGQVWARQLGKRFARKQQKGLAAAAQWYVELAGVAPG